VVDEVVGLDADADHRAGLVEGDRAAGDREGVVAGREDGDRAAGVGSQAGEGLAAFRQPEQERARAGAQHQRDRDRVRGLTGGGEDGDRPLRPVRQLVQLRPRRGAAPG
jgi:hypothetical protein